VLGTGLLPFLFGKVATMDALVAACVTASTGLLGLRYLGIAGPLAVPAAYAFAGLAVLAKGALGLLPGLVALGYVLLRRDGRAFRESLSPAGLLLFLAIAAPWHLLVLRDQGQAFLDVYVLNHNLARFTSEIHRHPGSPLYYLPVIIAGLFPWSGLLVPAAAALRPRRAPADLFVLLWFLLPLGLISAAGSKLPGYVLPCLPPLAILMGRSVEAMAAGAVSGVLRRLASLLTLVLGALLAAAPFLLARQGEPAWRAALPLGGWALTVAFLFSRRSERDPRGALALLRVGAPGLLVLLMLAAPEILARRESGRILFLPARGRPVLAWGAWRTAWMSGYFYNDGRVRWIGERRELDTALSGGPTLVVCGPRERDVLEADPGIQLAVLATGPRGNVLVRLDRR
jgi:4-amino-4-deoxy-L-arabinose transferase-like glycosyltransferase